MRKLAVLSAAVAALGGANFASAADLSYKDTAAYEAPLAPIWGGLYVGGHVGGLWNDGGDASSSWRKWVKCKKERKEHKGHKGHKDDYEPVLTRIASTPCEEQWSDWEKVENVKFSDDENDVNFVGGLHLGYNWQSGSRVFGVEADGSFSDGLDYLASLRARLGYARDNLLLYVTAGVAFAGFDDSSVTVSHGDFKKTFDFDGNSEVGLVVGAGAEYKLRSNWSIGVEGLYYAFGDGDDSQEWEAFCKQYKLVSEDDNDLFVVRARLSYHFQDEYEEPLK